MLAVLPLLLLCLFCSVSAQQQLWQIQRDDLSEYQLHRSVPAKLLIHCAMMAEPEHHAVEFSQEEGTCRMYICQLGWSGCRKCRNAKNSSMPLLMMKRLDKLGLTCWRTFQHRVDGSVDFYRNWTEYLTSFGQGEDLNYWMGLEAINQLTQAGHRRVRWEMSMWNGSWFWWENLFFAVRGADQGFRVDVGDQDISRSNFILITLALGSMDDQLFSTYDNDQDSATSNCAATLNAGWWYRGCHNFNPNGRYFTPPAALSLSSADRSNAISVRSQDRVYPFDQQYSMKTFECMVADRL